jgi:hypothetical protein
MIDPGTANCLLRWQTISSFIKSLTACQPLRRISLPIGDRIPFRIKKYRGPAMTSILFWIPETLMVG